MPERELPTEERELDQAAENPTQATGTTAPLTLFGKQKGQLTRRRLLATTAASGAALGFVGLYQATGAQETTPVPGPNASPGSGFGATAAASPMAGMSEADMNPQHANTNTGFVNFVPEQIKILRAAVNRLIPTDENGPGAEEAGVVYFIDRQMYTDKYYAGQRYASGPYAAGEATQGDQSLLTIRDRFRIGLFSLDAYAKSQNNGTAFADLSADKQDAVLSDLQAGKADPAFGSISITGTDPLTPATTGGQPGYSGAAFFSLLWQYTEAGFFCDPVHGGNRDMVGWKLIGFPGAHLSWADQIENYNQPFQGDFISLGQYQQQVGGES